MIYPIRILLLLSISLLMTGCVSLPDGVTPVTDFDSQRYVGKWYEIARLDNRFERGLSKVTASYAVRADGGIDVVNRGYKTGEVVPSEAIGKAYSVGAADTAHLKVSFFGPFYASYVVFYLDSDYQFAFVSGNSRKYLWLLSRTPAIDESVKELFLNQARSLGFDVSKLVWVEQ